MSERAEPAAELNSNQLAILDAIHKGFHGLADVMDFCGPRFEAQERGLDSSGYLTEVETLVDTGYLERQSPNRTGQLIFSLTEKGLDAAPELSDEEAEVVDAHGVPLVALRILREVIDYREETGDLPAVSELQDRMPDIESSSYFFVVVFNSLVERDLANGKGLIRYKIEPTAAGEALVEEYDAHL